MKNFIRKKFINFGFYLFHFFQTQLVITLVSLPILISWGLGISIMTLISNLVFAPILMLFLIISSLLFFTELMGIPNKLLATALNALTASWDHVLSQGSARWLITFPKPSIIILLAIPIITFIVLQHRSINTIKRRFLAITCIFCLACSTLSLYQYSHSGATQAVRFDEKLYTIKLIDNSLIIVDRGFFSRKKSVDKSIEYELKPWLTKKFGNFSVKEFRILNPTTGSFKAACYLSTLWPVEAIWLPFFKKSLSKSCWRAFFQLKRFLTDHNIRFVRYKK